jgi:hypothetical protein
VGFAVVFVEVGLTVFCGVIVGVAGIVVTIVCEIVVNVGASVGVFVRGTSRKVIVLPPLVIFPIPAVGSLVLYISRIEFRFWVSVNVYVPGGFMIEPSALRAFLFQLDPSLQ